MVSPPSCPASWMAACWSRLSPVPVIPDCTGPYAVGSVDLELPMAAAGAPAPAEVQAAGITTVQFRVFYPADAASAAAAPRVRWLPEPQRQYVAAYAQFLGAGARVAELVSFLGRHLHYVELPVGENAAMAAGPDGGPDGPDGHDGRDGRWPTMVFSHGLGGSRNAYAYLAASVASHGVVVVCPEHRDGSAVVSYMRATASPGAKAAVAIPFRHIPHSETPEVSAARDAQLRIRLWELGRMHDALLRLDGGGAGADDDGDDDGRDVARENLADNTPAAAVAQFAGRLDVRRPGAIAWAGHSFGAATVVQLVKTVFYGASVLSDALAADTTLRAQITAASPTILLDVWCFPLRSPATRALYARPLPAWSAPGVPGNPLLAVGSESFYRWTEHLHATAQVLSPGGPGGPGAAPTTAATTAPTIPPPAVFYVARSAHLSQSDFGLVFPWLTRAVFKAPAPERALELNVRAIVQLLRQNGAAVQGGGNTDDDTAILEPHGAVADWVWVDVVALAKEGGVDDDDDDDDPSDKATEASMERAMEPHIAAA